MSGISRDERKKELGRLTRELQEAEEARKKLGLVVTTAIAKKSIELDAQIASLREKRRKVIEELQTEKA